MLNRFKQALKWRKRAWRRRITLVRARIKRQQLPDTVFVGITGSLGKTTTKDLAVSVLGQRGITQGNSLGLNYLEDIGQAILKISKKCRYAVFEIATSGPGTIDDRIKLVRPSIAAMTVIGRDHIKSFGSMEAIAEEKSKLIKELPPHGVAVLNMDDPLIRAVGNQTPARHIWFGTDAEADLRVIEASSSFPDPLTLTIEYQGTSHVCKTGVHGKHLTVPVLAAMGIGLAAGLSIGECIAGVKDVQTTPGRMQIAPSSAGVVFLRDDFKAPHWSVQVVLDYLRDARATRKVAVIGTMSDYSLSASKLYPKVARRALEVADLVLFIGPHALRALKARTAENQNRLFGFTDIEQAHQFLQGELTENDLVLLKGTNRVDHLVRLLLARHKPVHCWVSDCGWNRFCDACPRLEHPTPHRVDTQISADASTEGGEIRSATDRPSVLPENATTGNGRWLVVGLGNPGEQYAGTPHNVGFEVLDHLARQLKLDWHADSNGMATSLEVSGHEHVFFKPGTAINLAGPAVESACAHFGIPRDHILVIHDDADLPMSRVRLKRKGSDGGHKGVRSLISALHNDGFMPRIRIGVRNNVGYEDPARSLVLQQFSSADLMKMSQGVKDGATSALEFLGADRSLLQTLLK